MVLENDILQLYSEPVRYKWLICLSTRQTAKSMQFLGNSGKNMFSHHNLILKLENIGFHTDLVYQQLFIQP